MSTQNNYVLSVDTDEKWMERLGGIAALIFGLGYILIMVLYVPMGAPPNGAEARLAYMVGNVGLWWAILGVSVLTDFLLVPVAFGLYQSLKGIHKNLIRLAVVCIGLFIIFDLALTWTNYAVLIPLSESYSAAMNDVQKAAIVAAAQYPTAVLESNLLFVYNTLTLSVGILIVGLVMLKGVFSKGTAYLGLVTGILGIVAVVGPYLIRSLDVTIIFASVLTMVWAFAVGFKLYRLGRH